MLTVHHVMIPGKWPTWNTILYYGFIFTFIFNSLHRAHHQERQIVSTQPLVTVTLCRWPCRVQVGNELPTCTRYNKNKYTVKNCASHWSFTKNQIRKCTHRVTFLAILLTCIWTPIKHKTSKMLHLEHGFVWCWNLDASGSRSETPGKFWNVVLEKDGEDQLDRSCEKWRSVT